MSGSGISWAVCKSAACSRQITTPAPHHSDFYRPDALHAAQPTESKHWRQNTKEKSITYRYDNQPPRYLLVDNWRPIDSIGLQIRGRWYARDMHVAVQLNWSCLWHTRGRRCWHWRRHCVTANRRRPTLTCGLYAPTVQYHQPTINRTYRLLPAIELLA